MAHDGDKQTFGEDNLGADGDQLYEALMNAHEGLSPQASQALNARLILLMANHIGDAKTVKALLALAKSYR